MGKNWGILGRKRAVLGDTFGGFCVLQNFIGQKMKPLQVWVKFFGNKSQRIWPILNEQFPPNSRFKKRIGCWVKKGVGDKRSEGEREKETLNINKI